MEISEGRVYGVVESPVSSWRWQLIVALRLSEYWCFFSCRFSSYVLLGILARKMQNRFISESFWPRNICESHFCRSKNRCPFQNHFSSNLWKHQSVVSVQQSLFKKTVTKITFWIYSNHFLCLQLFFFYFLSGKCPT